MRNRIIVLLGLTATLSLSSCVSKKKYRAIQGSNETLRLDKDSLRRALERCAFEQDNLKEQLSGARQLNAELSANNAAMAQAVGNLAQSSTKEAENMARTLESLREKDAQVTKLWHAKSARDSTNLALVTSLKGALGNMDDPDIDINVDKGVVFVSISDKLLFKSGSTAISGGAAQVLGKVATVVNARPDLDFIVEGHTDDVPINRDGMKDNWDLSVLRAAAIVRALQKDHGVNPARMTASGRAQFAPLVSNDSEENKAKNRRTRIVVLPKLDQFSKMIEEGLEKLEKDE